MKKSNKTSFLYIFSSVSLLLVLIFGGCYGIYISVGMSFVRRGISNLTDTGATNVSFGGTLNFQTSMLGVIVLSVALIVISILDFISLIKQVSFFKQFSVVKNSKIVKNIEKKSKSKGKIVFFAVFIDVISFIAGLLGIFINMRTFPNGNMIWVIYVVDGLISILSVVSIVLLIVKLKKIKKIENERNKSIESKEIYEDNDSDKTVQKEIYFSNELNINEIEYKLLKLKQLKLSRIITSEEFERLRKYVIKDEPKEINSEEIQVKK